MIPDEISVEPFTFTGRDGPVTVRLHAFRLDLPVHGMDEAMRLLSPDEIDRAARLRIEVQARRFRVARAGLRRILAEYVDEPAHMIRLRIAETGKPGLDTVRNPRDVRFSLSHSGDLAVVAVCAGCALGVDIERIRPIDAVCDIADRYFRPEEARAIRAAGGDDRRKLFFRAWTTMEASLKAAGCGLAGWHNRDAVAAAVAATHHFEPAPGYTGCCVCLTDPHR